MRDDEDRWHYHQVLLRFLGEAVQSRSVFFTVCERSFDRGEFVKGLRFWRPATLVEDVIVDGQTWDE